MFNKLHAILLILSLVVTPIFGQNADTTEFEEEGGNEMFTSVDVSYSQDRGNTDFLSMYYGFSFSVVGDVGPLTDTEFSINFSRSNDILDDEPFTDDQSLTLKFDLWANQKISPFLFLQKSFDKTIGLENRLNYGVGAKLGLLKGFSISYAFLAENEEYVPAYNFDSTLVDTNDFYWDVGYTDVSGDSIFFAYDSTLEAAKENFLRHSFRPKYKVKLFDGNVVFDYRFYFKPRVDNFEDYLLEHELKISVMTFYEALSVDFNYTSKYNSRYAGVKIINPDTGKDYDDTDKNISIGLSFMF